MTENSTHIDNLVPESGEKDNLNEGISEATDTAEAVKNEEKSANAYGKFNSVEALLSAYLSLEAEFTRRSQRLKELEESKADGAPSHGEQDTDGLLKAVLENGNVRDAVISEYLKSVFAGKSVPIIVGGVACSAPQSVPKSVKEAGSLAKQFLKN